MLAYGKVSLSRTRHMYIDNTHAVAVALALGAVVVKLEESVARTAVRVRAVGTTPAGVDVVPLNGNVPVVRRDEGDIGARDTGVQGELEDAAAGALEAAPRVEVGKGSVERAVNGE